MPDLPLTPDQFRRLVHLTATRAGILTTLERQNLLDLAGLNEFAPRLDFSTPAQTFSAQLIRTLQEHGTLRQTGQPALVSLLRELATIVQGHEDEAEFIATLLAPYDKLRTASAGKRLKVFVSYRRKSWAFTHRMAGDLKQVLDADIFVDITGVDQANFADSILSHLRVADVVLLVVSEFTFSERIQEPNDWVRHEIALALELRKPIVLIAVEGLFPPAAAMLPPDIRGVTRMQGIKFYPEFWEAALTQLAEFIPKVVTSPVPDIAPPQQPVNPSDSPAPVSPDYAAQLQQAIDLMESDNGIAALPLLEALNAAQYRPRVVTPMLTHARADAAKHQKKMEAERAREQHRIRLQDSYDEIAMLARTRRTVDTARQEWAQFVESYPDWYAILGSDSHDLDRVLKPFTLPLLDWIPIPAGQVKLERGWDGNKYSSETSGEFEVAPFQIAKYPVTNAQFQAFVDDGGYREDRYWKDLAQRETTAAEPAWNDANCPRERVNWYEAVAFTRWLSVKLGRVVRLPREIEWQWAAVGDTGWAYPYGNSPDASKANTNESKIGRTTPVDQYPQGASPFGVMDMSGNVWEWCLNIFADPKVANISSVEPRVVRGGSWNYNQYLARAASRNWNPPDNRNSNIGFRVVCVPSGTL